MPYVICARCRLSTYSAALWSRTDECPRCGTKLPASERAAAVSLADRAGLLRRRRDARADAPLQRPHEDA